MSTKTITVTEEAYNRLKSARGEKESFTDAIIRITNKDPLSKLVGILTKEEATELRMHVKDLRQRMNERVEETARRLR